MDRKKAVEGAEENNQSEVSPDEVVSISKSLLQFLRTRLHIDTKSFYSEVDSESFGDQSIRIVCTSKLGEIPQDAPFYYLYRTPQAFLVTGGKYGRPYDYFTNYQDAAIECERLKKQGYDVYLRESVSSADEEANTTIDRRLFSIDLIDGLIAIAHEPLHFQITENNNWYALEEGLTTLLSFEILRLFLKEYTMNPKIFETFEKQYNDDIEFTRFIRRAYKDLNDAYVSENTNLRRTQAQQKLFDTLKEEYGQLFSSTEASNRGMEEFNNAFLLSNIDHSGFVVIKDYFEQNDISVEQFITDSKLRHEVLAKLTTLLQAS